MMHCKTLINILAIFLVAAMVGAPGVSKASDDKHENHHNKNAPPAAAERKSGPVRVKLLDEPVLDQDGRKFKFASEVIADRIVVMDFIYTTCTTTCPILTAILKDVQGRLGNKLNNEVRMVSISVDPGTDTPRRLKEYARKHKAGPGWIFLTGGKHVIDKVLNGLGAYSQDFTAHPTSVLIGDGRSGEWKRLYGFANPQEIVARVDELLAARREAKHSTHKSENVQGEVALR